MRISAAVLCLAVLAPLAGCGDGGGSGDDGDDGTSAVELSYDDRGLTVVIDVGDDVDLRTARDHYTYVKVGTPDRNTAYTLDLTRIGSNPRMADAEGGPLVCGQSAEVTARTLTLVLPDRCTSKSDPSPRKPLLGDPLNVWTVSLEASFKGTDEPVVVELRDQVLERS